MTDPEPTLLLTRPEAQSKAFLIICEKAAGRRLPAIISPVMSISHTGELPDLDNYATIIFTSGNGVKAALETASLKGRCVATVGQRTAELAQSAGASAVSLGDDVEAFLSAVHDLAGPVLSRPGEPVRFESRTTGDVTSLAWSFGDGGAGARILAAIDAADVVAAQEMGFDIKLLAVADLVAELEPLGVFARQVELAL